MRTFRMLFICLLIPAAVAAAQENPLSTANRGLYQGIQKIVIQSARLMPEEKYAFRPTEEVRTFGQVLGHVADSQYFFCSPVAGEKNPGLMIEKNKTSKADLIAALEAAFAYCNKSYDSITDKTGTEIVKVMGDSPKLSALSVNNVHTAMHYGNLIVYLRMNGIVPPSSDPELMKRLRARQSE